MSLTPKEKIEMNKDIANRVYTEGLNFKGVVEEQKKRIGTLTGAVSECERKIEMLEEEVSRFKNLLYSQKLKIDRLDRRTQTDIIRNPMTFGTNFHRLMEDLIGKDIYIKDAHISENNNPKGYKAREDWEEFVRSFSRMHPRNRVAYMLATEPDGKTKRNFPFNHGKYWQPEEDSDLDSDLRDFIRSAAIKHMRNPSSIAFRIIRHLKYIGIDLT